VKESFKELGLVPNRATYYHLIELFSNTRRVERALDIFNEMKLAGFAPTLYVYSSLITVVPS